jgi:restriction endonuclease S subunit
MKKNENNWSRLSTGSTFSAIKGSSLKNFEIPLPSLETQKQIAAKLSAVQNYKTQLLAQKSKLKELFDSALAKSFK